MLLRKSQWSISTSNGNQWWVNAARWGLWRNLPLNVPGKLYSHVRDAEAGGDRFTLVEEGRAIAVAFVHPFAADADGVVGAVAVSPQNRNRGVATYFAGTILRDAASRGFKSLHHSLRYGETAPPAASKFLTSMNFVHQTTSDELTLYLDADPALDSSSSNGVQIVTWRGHCPENIVANYARLAAGKFAAGKLPLPTLAEMYRSSEARMRRAGLDALVSVASTEGRLVGHSRVILRSGSHVAEQAYTFVDPSFRKKGVAYRLKSENVRWIRRFAPEISQIRSVNQQGNAAIGLVNRRLDFRRLAVIEEYRLDLATPLAGA